MRNRQREIVEVLQRVNEFCKAHPVPEPEPSYADMLARLNAVIATIQMHAADQDAGEGSAREATRIRRSLVHTLRDQHMTPLRETATALLRDVPGIEQNFRVPRSNANITAVLTAARRMLQHAPMHEDVFIRNGRPKTFLTQLELMVAAVEHASEVRYEGLRRSAGATEELDVAFFEARKTLSLLNTIMRTKFVGNRKLLREWNVVRRFQPRITPLETPASQEAPTGAPSDGGSTGSPATPATPQLQLAA